MCSCGTSGHYTPRTGDIIFQTSTSGQSVAVQKATHSRWSHVGIVLVKNGKPVVAEAVEPVQLTPLAAWCRRGVDGRHAVKRLKDSEQILTPASQAKLRAAVLSKIGAHYDAAFQWSDERLYCSEFVWKAFHDALGLAPGRLQRLGDFDFSDAGVRATAEARWHGPPPAGEPAVSPAAIFESELLFSVGGE